MAKIKVTLIKSLNGRPNMQRKVVTGLGLKKINNTVILEDTPSIRGMINKVFHLIVVEREYNNET